MITMIWTESDWLDVDPPDDMDLGRPEAKLISEIWTDWVKSLSQLSKHERHIAEHVGVRVVNRRAERREKSPPTLRRESGITSAVPPQTPPRFFQELMWISKPHTPRMPPEEVGGSLKPAVSCDHNISHLSGLCAGHVIFDVELSSSSDPAVSLAASLNGAMQPILSMPDLY